VKIVSSGPGGLEKEQMSGTRLWKPFQHVVSQGNATFNLIFTKNTGYQTTGYSVLLSGNLEIWTEWSLVSSLLWERQNREVWGSYD
jgi:hypothetical protein